MFFANLGHIVTKDNTTDSFCQTKSSVTLNSFDDNENFRSKTKLIEFNMH